MLRCAVVGSSGLLQRQRVAAEIDGHDMVMRFNMAPVDGYEHIVGGRTTLRMLNSEVPALASGTQETPVNINY
eukprot:1866942-Amphidinium_carterae.1